MEKSHTHDATSSLPRRAPHYVVADLEIDGGRQQVLRDGVVIPVPGLSFDLLVALARAAPDLVSNHDLLEQVWPKSVVNPETLNQRVRLLRAALGDDSAHPRYIEGLRGRGYRLIPPVQLELGTPASVAPGIDPAPDGSPASYDGAAPLDDAVEVSSPRPDAVIASQSGVPARRSRAAIFFAMFAIALIIAIVAVAWSVGVQHHMSTSRRATTANAAAVRTHAVAVMPFKNLSPASGNDYLALSVSDAVQQKLARAPGLIVVARSSVLDRADHTLNAVAVGRALAVRYIVEGSVQRRVDTLRVTAHLIDTRANREIWSLKRDRPIGALFQLEDQISDEIAHQIDVAMQGRSTAYARYGAVVTQAFLRAQGLVATGRLDDVRAGIRQYQRAVQFAPTFPEAIAGLCAAQLFLADLLDDGASTVRRILRRCNTLVERAIASNPRAGELYFFRAGYRVAIEHDAAGAAADFRTATTLAPAFGPGFRAYGASLIANGRPAEALVAIDRARRVDPRDPESDYLEGQIMRNAFGDSAKSATFYRQAIAAAPRFYPAYARLGEALAAQGQLAEALRMGEKAVAIEPGLAWVRDRLVWFYVDLGDIRAARAVVRGYQSGSAQRTISEALICYRTGRVQQAADLFAAAMNANSASRNTLAVTLVTDAIVTRAVALKEPVAARNIIVSLPGLKRQGRSLAVAVINYPAVVQLAILESLVGRRALGESLARRILEFLDRGGTFGPAGADHWARANAAALLGREQEAMAQLERLVHTNRLGWWDRIEGNPALRELDSDPRFRAIQTEDQIWLAREQERFGRLQRIGAVPIRVAHLSRSAGC